MASRFPAQLQRHIAQSQRWGAPVFIQPTDARPAEADTFLLRQPMQKCTASLAFLFTMAGFADIHLITVDGDAILSITTQVEANAVRLQVKTPRAAGEYPAPGNHSPQGGNLQQRVAVIVAEHDITQCDARIAPLPPRLNVAKLELYWQMLGELALQRLSPLLDIGQQPVTHAQK